MNSIEQRITALEADNARLTADNRRLQDLLTTRNPENWTGPLGYAELRRLRDEATYKLGDRVRFRDFGDDIGTITGVGSDGLFIVRWDDVLLGAEAFEPFGG